MEKQVKTLLKRTEIMYNELRSNTAIINKLKTHHTKHSQGSHEDERFGNLNLSQSFRSNLKPHMKNSNSKRDFSQSSFQLH